MSKDNFSSRSVGVEAEIAKVTVGALEEVQHIADATERQFEQTVAPIRKSILKRFPTLFLLAVTFGFSATMTGMEQLIVQYQFLQDHPSIMLGMGIGTLLITGTLYKKLG